MLHSSARFIRVFALGVAATSLVLAGCVRQHSQPIAAAGDADDLQAELLRYVEQHRAEAKRGFYPDGTKLGPTCLLVTVEACLVDHFLAERGIVDELDPAAFDPQAYLLIDVRGETERARNPLPEHVEHHVVQYGFDNHDPLALDDLDREAFADALRDARSNDPRPVALLCTVGMRSRAAVAALRDAGIADAVSLRGGLAARPAFITPAS